MSPEDLGNTNQQPSDDQEGSSHGTKSKTGIDEIASQDRIVALQKQVEFNYLNFDRRRSYEWKLSLALWTAFAAFIALVLRGDVQEIQKEIIRWAYIVPIIIVILHLYFLVMLLKANKVDKKKSWYFENTLNALMHTGWENQEESCDPKGTIDEFKNCKLRLDGYWSCVVQVGITLVLLLALWGVLHKKTVVAQTSRSAYKLVLQYSNEEN